MLGKKGPNNISLCKFHNEIWVQTGVVVSRSTKAIKGPRMLRKPGKKTQGKDLPPEGP